MRCSTLFSHKWPRCFAVNPRDRAPATARVRTFFFSSVGTESTPRRPASIATSMARSGLEERWIAFEIILRRFIGTFSGICAMRWNTSENPWRYIKCSISSAGNAVKCSRSASRSLFNRLRTVAAYFFPASSPSTSTCHSIPIRRANLTSGFSPDWANSMTLIPSASK